jgi:formylglycine-generating enzyme required for sulfatase activity
VTVAQFRRFHMAAYGRDYAENNKQYSPTDDCPVNMVTWYLGAHYCNWLSAQEGLDEDQWCYEPNDKGQYAEGMKLAPDYLKRTGYRLPSEAEWEYACRAGALTSRYYGETEELLHKYAWFAVNSRDRMHSDCLKPNELGLFDMLGNAMEWCQEGLGVYAGLEDKEDTKPITDSLKRMLRGGPFNFPAASIRSAVRFWLEPTRRLYTVGFRPAKTFLAN